MRPRLFTPRNIILFLVAAGIFTGLAYWLNMGAPLPFGRVPSTAGKIAFVSDRDGAGDHLWMMDGKEGGSAVRLTTSGEDSQPAWSPSGSEIAYITRATASGTPQIYRMDARPGAHAIPVSNTSATKEQPSYDSRGIIYYLSSGKLTQTNPVNQDTDQVFPEADAMKALYGDDEHPGLLSTGGIIRAQPSPDGRTIAISVRTEHGQALLLYDEAAKACALLGLAEKTLFQFLPDGHLLAVFGKGTPTQQPLLLFNEESLHSLPVVPALNMPPPAADGSPIVVFDTSGAVAGAVTQLPFVPDEVTVSPDGKLLAIALSHPEKAPEGSTFAGLVLLPLDPSAGKAGPLVSELTKDLSWSPDGKQLAFVSGKDVWTVSADRSAPPVNLTAGKGTNRSPVWSPTKLEAK